jgi:hypothetical protein
MANFLPIPPTNAVSDPQARAALDALSQNIQIAINTFATKASVTASSTAVSTTVGNTYGNISSSVNMPPLAAAYTRARLTQDLETGAASIISNGNTSDNIMKTGLNYILFQNKNAIPLGSTGAYTGTVRTALGLLSTGIVGGYNDPSTGNWVSSITIDTATGNLNVLGTIKANSIIQVGAYLGTDTVSTVLGNITTANSTANSALSTANTAITNANTAIASAASKLSKSASDILSGTINFSGAGGFATGSISINSSGVASGSGVALTSKGIVGLNSGTPTFSINATTGAASFSGDITGSNGTFTGTLNAVGGTFTGSLVAASGTFTGDITSSGHFSLSGTGFIYGGSSSANTVAYINGSSTIYGLVVDGGGLFSTAIKAYTTAGGVSVYGVTAGGIGLSAYDSAAGIAINATSVSGTALAISGFFNHNGVRIATPPNSNTYFLAGDGSWYPISGITAGVSSFNTRVGAVTLSSGDVTGALGYTPYDSSNPSGYVTTSTSSLSNYSTTSTTLAYIAGYSSQFNANSGAATASTSQINLYGSTSTGIAGAYVGTSGSGNTVTFTVQVSSPSDIRLKEEITNSDLGLSFVKQLRPVSYKLKSDPKHQKGYGFIADEVEKLVELGSSLVYEDPNWQVEDQIGFKTIHYPSYIAVLTKAIQELDIKVTLLESKNA